MQSNKMYLQIMEEGDTVWSTLNTIELGDRRKWKEELEEKMRHWRATHYPNARFRITDTKQGK